MILAYANGVGKTSIVFGILWAIMAGAPTTAFDYQLYREYPKKWPKMVRIVTESALVNSLGPVQVESGKWWPKGRYEWFKGGKGHNSIFCTDTGFTGEVMTYEQANKEFEGKTIAVNVFIEPPPREIFNACVARQRMGGLNIFDMTPLTSSAWVMDEIVSKPEITIDGKMVGKAKCIHADIEMNCRQHGINGQLEHSNIQQIISRYDPDEIDARVHGKFMHLSGRILKGFDRSIHVLAKAPELPQGCAIYQVLDPAIAKPIACIWAFVDAARRITIYDEWPEFDFQGAKDSNMTVKDYGELFKSRENGRKVQERIIDRHFAGVRRTLGGETLKEEFGAIGFDFTDSYHVAEGMAEVETGILKVKEYLAYDKTKPIDNLNQPKLYISPTCTNTIKALERWSRDPKNGKPLDEFKDFCDVVRYLSMAEPAIDTPQQWGKGTKPYWGVA